MPSRFHRLVQPSLHRLGLAADDAGALVGTLCLLLCLRLMRSAARR